MSEEIKEGDVVVLKSGGPKMTVTSVGDHYGTPTGWCAWFDGKKQCNGTFNLMALQISD
jgi:uncharacterized protein YodC (DUF2158 family)